MRRLLPLLAAAAALGCARLKLDELRYRLIDAAELGAPILEAGLRADPAATTSPEREVLAALEKGGLQIGYVGGDGRLRHASAGPAGSELNEWLSRGGFGAAAAALAWEYRRPAVLCPSADACELAYPLIEGGRFEGLLIARADPAKVDAPALVAAQLDLSRKLAP